MEGLLSSAGLPPLNTHLQQLLASYDFAFVVSDCSERDMPIVFASSKFYDVTGYSPQEVRHEEVCCSSSGSSALSAVS